jgi:hypothetical protein
LRETETDGGDGVYGGAPLGVAVLVAATAMSCTTPTHHIHLSEYEQEELQLQAENLFSSVAVGSDWSGSDGSVWSGSDGSGRFGTVFLKEVESG